MEKMNCWFVYIIKTNCGKLYTGITVNIERRFQEHLDVFNACGKKGAKFFRGHQPSKVVYSEVCESRSAASKREYQIKAMSKSDKQNLFKPSKNKI